MVDRKREELRTLLRSAPKPQLHLHLDGSLSFAFIQESMGRLKQRHEYSNYNFFFDTPREPENAEQLRVWLMELKKKQIDSGSIVGSNSNWKVFDFCNQFLQTSEDLRSATHSLVCTLNEQHNVNYIEIRFAPVLHTSMGITEQMAVESVVEGFRDAVHKLSTSNVRVAGGIILCALRSYSIEKAFETLELCKKVEGVVGFDVAGDEGSYPLSIFKDVLITAKSSHVKTTVHAGEWDEISNPISLENVQLALDLNVDRIGHGLAVRSASKELIDKLVQQNIPLEVCLTSNCGNPKKCKNYEEHPLPDMLRKSIIVSGLNVDNTLLSGSLDTGAPNPTDECVRALLDCGLSARELLSVIKNGYSNAFGTDDDLSNIHNDAMEEWLRFYLPEIERILAN